MEYFNKIEWHTMWGITKDIILPHLGTLIFNGIIFLVVGFILSIFYILFLQKKKAFNRIPKYYNWAVKLYIPILILVFLYFFGLIGVIRGTYMVLNKENKTITNTVYDNTLKFSFTSEESKNDFIINLQESVKEFKEGSKLMSQFLKKTAEQNTGYSVIDNNKNKVATFLIDKYGDDIYKITSYAMLNVAGAKAHININESLPYEKYSAAMDLLLEIGHKDIEEGIKDKLVIWFDSLLHTQFKSLVLSQVVLLLFIISLPLIELFIYKKWVLPKYIN